MVQGGSKVLGIVCGMGAGALWGLVFLAPELARDFNPVQLTVGRYASYGLMALALVLPHWRRLWARLGRREWVALLWLAFCGNVLYYVLLASAVQAGGIAMTSLIIGFLPVAVTLVGSRDHGAVPLRRLLPSLLFSAAGALCIGWQALAAPVSGSVWSQLTCIAFAVGALVSWTSYAVGNSRWLARLHDVSSHDWNLLTGVVTGSLSLLLLPLLAWGESQPHTIADWVRFAAVSTGISLAASIFGNVLWNRMSRLLPLTMVGQMILFETLFALLYGFLWDRRMPSLTEILAMILVVLSVLSCVAVHGKRDRNAQ